jgi:predicted transcriptional regulator
MALGADREGFSEPEAKAMNDLTIELAPELIERLTELASERNTTPSQLLADLATRALASLDAEQEFRAHAARGNRAEALAILARLDATFGSERA